MSKTELVVVIDFGSPFNQLLMRQIRELGVYCELRAHSITGAEIKELNPKAIIMSGSPNFINDAPNYRVDEAIFNSGIPILGICYGAQLLTDYFGGRVEHITERTYEREELEIQGGSLLFSDLVNKQMVYRSKGDMIIEAPATFQVNALFEDGSIATISNEAEGVYGVQFYPEKEETEHGIDILKNFLFSVSECKGDWSIERFIETEITHIQEVVGDKKVLCALSGGVDSSVVAALIHKAIGDQLTCIFVDHGLLRKNEANEVMASLADDFHMNIIQIDAVDRFLDKLAGVEDPEEKRKIIGNEFIYVFDEEAGKLTDVDF